jgi:predicted alpha/beta hydrolase family esterase
MIKLKRVFIIHGWEGTPKSNWFPWLKNELEKKDFQVIVPQMPHADHPLEQEWVSFLTKLVAIPDEYTYFVGHSLGCIAILRYIESLPIKSKIGGIVLVSGFTTSLAIPEIENFVDSDVAFGHIRSIVQHRIIIQSDDDPYVPMSQGEHLKEKLDAELHIIPHGGHLNEGSGHFIFPLIVENITSLIL